MARVRSLVAIFLFIVCSIPALADKRCKPSDRQIFVPAEQVYSGATFTADVPLAKHEVVSWEVSGGTIVSQDTYSVTIVAGAPGLLEISATIDKGGHCEQLTPRSVTVVPVPCFIEDRIVGVNFNPAKTGQEVIAATSVFEADGETVEWEVIGGTITRTDPPNFVYIRVGGVGTMEVNAHITKGECTKTFSRSVPVECYIGDRDISIGENPVPSNRQFWAGMGLWNDAESVEWTVRGNGSIAFIDNSATGASFASILAGGPGTIEIEATISRDGGACTRTFTKTVNVECRPDGTVGLFFEGGRAPGEPVHAWTNLTGAQTARWVVTGGTPSSAQGDDVIITPDAGVRTMIVDLYVDWYSCSEHRRTYFFY